MCCTMRMGNGKPAGSAGRIAPRAVGPPVDTPITTAFGRIFIVYCGDALRFRRGRSRSMCSFFRRGNGMLFRQAEELPDLWDHLFAQAGDRVIERPW